MTEFDSLSFATRAELLKWLRQHHAARTELWVRIYKKHSKVPSIDWNDCVIATLTWGWIDGQKRSLDADSYLQRITPRRAKSAWSKKNRSHAEALIAEGKMEAPGLLQVQAAQADGRFEQAYAGSADMELDPEFLTALEKNPAAKAAFEALPRSKIFSIYVAIHGAKKEATKQRRIAKAIEELSEGAEFPSKK